MQTLLAAARTLLFVPGDRPERFRKAADSGCDLAIMDLEDAVPPSRKDSARGEVASALANGSCRAVRINAVGTPWMQADVEALAHTPCVVMLPKADSAEAVASVVAQLASGSAVLALIETAQGALEAARIARVDGVERLAFGSFDLAAELGVVPDDRDAMGAARSALVLASAAARLPGPIDGVTGDIANDDALRSDVAYARRLGFTGKLCIHPRQVATAAQGFLPTEVEARWAASIVRAVEASSDAVVVVDGKMVDAPVVLRARRILSMISAP